MRVMIFSIVVVSIVILNGCTVSGKHPEIDHDIQTVSNISSSEEIHLDVVTDIHKTIHLVWQSQEKGIQYQTSTDGGGSWSQPITIDYEAYSGSSTEGARIFNHKDTLLIFWRHQGFNLKTSFNLGQTWIKQPMKIFKRTPIAKYEIVADDNVLFFAYSNQEGLFFRRSDNFGINWTAPKKIIGLQGHPLQISVPSMAIWENKVYLLWSEFDPGVMSSKLNFAHSEDKGKTWSRHNEINTNRSHLSSVYGDTYNIISPSIMAFPNSFLIFYEERGLFYKWVNTNINLSTQFVSRYPSRNYSLYNANDSMTYIVWSDARYQEKDWWAYIPGHQIVSWDNDLTWANNDLFVTSIRNHKKEDTTLLTPPLSYISSNKHAISTTKSGDELYIFWSGRKKVGKELNQYGFPVEVFYVNLELF